MIFIFATLTNLPLLECRVNGPARCNDYLDLHKEGLQGASPPPQPSPQPPTGHARVDRLRPAVQGDVSECLPFLRFLVWDLDDLGSCKGLRWLTSRETRVCCRIQLPNRIIRNPCEPLQSAHLIDEVLQLLRSDLRTPLRWGVTAGGPQLSLGSTSGVAFKGSSGRGVESMEGSGSLKFKVTQSRFGQPGVSA